MVFKRRKPLSTAQVIRDSFYPRTGWRRAIEYLGHRLKRLPDTPHKICLGLACGVFVSFSPLFGFHFIYAGLIAFILRGNILASFLGTLFGNPLTFPFIATLSLGLGRRMFGINHSDADFTSLKDSFAGAFSGLWDSMLSLVGLADPAWGRLADFWWQVFLPYFVGGIIPGFIVAFGIYLLSRPLVAAYQARRRIKMIERSRTVAGRKSAAAKAAAAGSTALAQAKAGVTNSGGTGMAKDSP